ncbi:hypothetical protein DENIT_13119 [Pseudomonas veronii]|nr:hypothetical protein DENIT_13119 [Pseudomonas veronii]
MGFALSSLPNTQTGPTILLFNIN